MKKIFVIITIIALIFVGCSSEDNNGDRGSEGGMNEDSDMDYLATDDMVSSEEQDYGNQMAPEINIEFSETVEDFTSDALKVTTTAANQRKIIKSGYITMETLKYDETIVKLQEKVAGYGGYIEVSNIGGTSLYNKNQARNAYFTLRIPQSNFQNFMEEVNTIGHVISQQENGQDITSTYYDTDARVRTMEIQEERLLEILKKADKIEDVIILEQELSSVRYEIERLTQSLRTWDQMVSYATLEVNINEVYEITEKEIVAISLNDKIKNGFESSIKDLKEGFETLIINLSSGVPYLIFIIPGLLIVIIIFLKIKKGYTSGKVSEKIIEDALVKKKDDL